MQSSHLHAGINMISGPSETSQHWGSNKPFLGEKLENRVITKGVFSLEECRESLDSLESLDNGRILLSFPQSGSSPESRISKFSRVSRKWTFMKPFFPKDPFFPNPNLRNGQNTVSRVLFRRRELTEPHWVLRQTRWVLQKNSVSSLWHTNSRPRGTHWVRSPEHSEPKKKLTEFGVWNRTLRNRIRPVSD